MKKTGIELIAEERQRQIEVEGWTLEHDIKNAPNELAIAASCYCLPEGKREFRVRDQWPFAYEWWKPTPENRIRELQKAGALIAAEIDRNLLLTEIGEFVTIPDKVMWVSDNSEFQTKKIRVVFGHKITQNGTFYMAWNDAETLEDAKNKRTVTTWKYVKNIDTKEL
jgi:hypothetical protein